MEMSQQMQHSSFPYFTRHSCDLTTNIDIVLVHLENKGISLPEDIQLHNRSSGRIRNCLHDGHWQSCWAEKERRSMTYIEHNTGVGQTKSGIIVGEGKVVAFLERHTVGIGQCRSVLDLLASEQQNVQGVP